MVDLGTSIHRRLLVLVAGLLAITLIGMVVLWPRAGDLPEFEPAAEELVDARVEALERVDAGADPLTGRDAEFLVVTVEILDGPSAGEMVVIEALADGYPDFAVGDRVKLAVAEFDGEPQYYLADFRRLPTLGVLVGLFVAAVLVISRWHGVRALLGLALSLLIVVQFVVPAILAGGNPPVVAWVGAMAVMVLTLYLTHGLNEMTTAAVVGTAASLTLTVTLGLLFISRGRITGFASDDAVFARFAVGELDLQGLVLAGLIIAALGVLDDVTVSQASTVFALHDTDRHLGFATLFARAMKVGRDHIASVVNTLFLAYAGASLALLVLFSTSGLATSEILNSEVLAEEIVKTVVGSLGLIAAVPFTTALAAAIAVRRPDDAPPLGGRRTHAGRGPRRPATVPPAAHPRRDVLDDNAELTDEERAYRSWLNYLRETGGPPRPDTADDPDVGDGPDGTGSPTSR
jgi:uncharacterized membrane protein